MLSALPSVQAESGSENADDHAYWLKPTHHNFSKLEQSVANNKTYTGSDLEAPDCPSKVGIASIDLETALSSPRFRKPSSVKCTAHTQKAALSAFAFA